MKKLGLFGLTIPEEYGGLGASLLLYALAAEEIFSKEYEIERLYREAPMLLIGEGTAEIQKMIIGRRLLEEYKIPGAR
jgi:alkylation response protein AidB-like acyl-CoA dehydrogenase